MLCGGRTDGAGQIGAGRGNRPPGGFDQGERGVMRRNADGERIQPRAGQQIDGAIGFPGQYQRQGTGPEGGRERPGPRIERHQRFGLCQSGHMDNQRVEMRASLGGKDPGQGLAVGGVAAQPVDRLGRKGDQPAGADQRSGLGDGRRGYGFDGQLSFPWAMNSGPWAMNSGLRNPSLPYASGWPSSVRTDPPAAASTA